MLGSSVRTEMVSLQATGVALLLVMVATALIRHVSSRGQMSLCGANVIVNTTRPLISIAGQTQRSKCSDNLRSLPDRLFLSESYNEFYSCGLMCRASP